MHRLIPATNSSAVAVASDTRLRLLLGAILLSAYLLVYMGVPSTIDGSATLAVTSSFVKHGTPDITVMGSAEALLPPLARMGSFGPDGLLYAKKGVTPSLLLLPLVGLAHIVPGLPVRATAMLLNPILTTLTALLLYTFARWLDYRPRVAFTVALVYGLGTFALVYTATLFGEPLAALLLLLAVMSAFSYRQRQNLRALLVAGAALGLTLGVNLSYAVMIPLVGLYAFGLDPRRWPLRHLARMVAPFLLILSLLLLYNLVRFGGLFESGYNFAEGEGFTSPFLTGVYGMLISPYRGVLWYNPILLLALPGMLLFRRHHPRLFWLAALLIVAQIAAYASWWSWHGGIVWGPRFLIPVMPLTALLLLPVIHRLQDSLALRVVFGVLFALSLFIQAAASIVSPNPHIIYLYQNYASTVVDGFFINHDPEVVYMLDASPLLAQIRLALSGAPELRPTVFKSGDALHFVFALAVLGIGLLTYHYAKSYRHHLIALVLIALLMLGTAARQQGTTAAAQAAQQELMPADLLIAASTSYDDNLTDLKTPTRIITTNAPTPPDDPLATGLWDYAMQQQGLAWFITWFPAASAENWQERDLWQRASFVRETIFREDRALLFDLHPPAQPNQPGGWRFGLIELAQYGLQRDPDGVRAAFTWVSDAPPETNHSWFVHLIDSSGQIIQQQDRPPQGGYTPTSTWQPSQPVTDYLFFPLPETTDTTGWQIRVGWLESDGSQRLAATTPAGAPVPDDFILLPVE